MNAFITSAYNTYRRVWEGMRGNFKQIIAMILLAIASVVFILLLFWAFVGQDGETIYLRVASAETIEVFYWLVGLAVSAIVSLTSYSYLKRHRTQP